MITVVIYINETPIYVRSAVNRGIDKEGTVGSDDEIHYYEMDDGSYIAHPRVAGAVALSKKLLDTINEQK